MTAVTEIMPFDFNGHPIRFGRSNNPLIKGLESYLYAVEFGDYGIKIGITASPDTRIAQHWRNGRDFGRPATRGLITAPHIEARTNERALIQHCREATGRIEIVRGEYFPIPLEAVEEFMAALPQSRGDRAAYEAKTSASSQGLTDFVVGGSQFTTRGAEAIGRLRTHNAALRSECEALEAVDRKMRLELDRVARDLPPATP